MRKIFVFCFMLVALVGLALASTDPVLTLTNDELAIVSGKEEAVVEAAPVMSQDDAIYSYYKTRYYALIERLNAEMATAGEVQEIRDICFSFNWLLPEALLPQEEEGRDFGSLDNGAPDTLNNCASATVIPGCPYTDSGNYDGDNDCSVISASPYNEVFYTFTPATSGLYQFRVRSYSTGVAAIRIMSGACCRTGTSVSVIFSSSSVATDCQNPFGGFEPTTLVTYTRASLTAGTQYWIHVGTSSSTAGIVAAYDLLMTCIPCPTNVEPNDRSNATCTGAIQIACGDSLMADSSSSTAPDWFKVIIPAGSYDSLIVKVVAREFGHCISGLYPYNSPLAAVDCKFSIFKDNGTCPGDSLIYDDDGTHGYASCQYDSYAGVCAGPGTYYIRVWNFSGLGNYIVFPRCVPCPPPVDCQTFYPCGSPAEVEPNTTCADAANFISLSCTDGVTQTVYGTICPQADVDYYFINTIPAGRQIDIRLFEGANCDLPTGGLAMRGATGAGFVCAAATGTATRRYLIGSLCGPETAGGWFGVVRSSGPEQRYKITVDCIALQCPDVALPNQHCAGPCVGPILDVSTVSYSINVPIEYHITDLNVRLNAGHTWDSDLDIYLVTPWSDTLELSTDNGGSGANYQVTVFDDAGTNGLITAGVAPFNGSYIPEELLAAVNGLNAIGTWTLVITDDTGGDVGYVYCWCLEFEYDYILAVELSSFTAVTGDNSVELQWTTASETDNDRFDIMRSGSLIGTVDAANAAHNYSWTDTRALNGTTYSYSLVAVDINGTRQTLGTVEATPGMSAVTVTEYDLHQNYPNPFNPTTDIVYDMKEAGFVTVRIYNLLGQAVATLVNGTVSEGRHTVTFDATGLPSGLYVYKMETAGFSAQHKMLLMK
jgi:subtilisin-like proprotein convertase family protein